MQLAKPSPCTAKLLPQMQTYIVPFGNFSAWEQEVPHTTVNFFFLSAEYNADID